MTDELGMDAIESNDDAGTSIENAHNTGTCRFLLLAANARQRGLLIL